MSRNTFLLELGCEELPSSNLRSLAESLHVAVTSQLNQHKLEYGQSRWLASPRRLAVLVEDLAEQAPDEAKETLGPPLAQARDKEGNWSRAAEGFAARQGVTADDLEVINTPKGERLGWRQQVQGAATRECLATIAEAAIDGLALPKKMRWGAGRREFARPVHWIVLMYGEEHGFGEVMDLRSANVTRGHRFHAPEPIALTTAEDYEERLRSAYVIANFAERSDLVRKQVESLAKANNASAIIDENLLEEVTSLVEWPVALAGSFDETFLKVPAEALISSMQSHQKYFPLQSAEGDLLPRFITVSNIESQDPAKVVAGNERVIRPRLADAAFFFEKDQQQRLDSRLARLADVVFQQKLGSLLDKTHRVQRLGAALANEIGADITLTKRAAELAKVDLVSDMVQEFGDLQGIAGDYYARNDGEDPEVARAINEHYWPKQAGSALPSTAIGTAVALADRLDTLLGIFAIGQLPSGSKDPFALRRASIAVLRIIIEGDLSLDLKHCLQLTEDGFSDDLVKVGTQEQVLEYVLDRMPSLYEDEGLAIEVLRAVRAIGCTQPADFDRRVRAVALFTQREEAAALAAANKRVGNILSKAVHSELADKVSTHLLIEPQERDLFAKLTETETENAAHLENKDYAAALGKLATLRAPVDAFFDAVMVNAEDPALRQNRLTLLAKLRAQFLAIADISQLAS